MKLFIRTITLVLILFLNPELSAQETYEPPKLSDEKSWSMILLPDTQSYVKFGRNQGILDLMVAWIEENIDQLNIEMVMCTGDLVEHNEIVVPVGRGGNQPSRSQWLAISNSFKRLDGKIPYILAAGNHDFGYKNIEHRRSFYNTYFPAHKNPSNEKLLVAVAKNYEKHPTLENAAFEFVSPHNRKFLFMNLEFAPRDTVLKWAEKLVNLPKFKDHTVSVLTHSYLNAKNEHIVKEGYPIEDGNYGQAIFNKLVRPSSNVQLVFSGHIGAVNNFRAHVGFRTDENSAGKKVNQMTFNAQAMGGGWHGNGGNGWLRILEFLPDGKTVNVRTFSPFFAISPSTAHLAWSRESFNEFSFELD